jgi:hypothetical protein
LEENRGTQSKKRGMKAEEEEEGKGQSRGEAEAEADGRENAARGAKGEWNVSKWPGAEQSRVEKSLRKFRLNGTRQERKEERRGRNGRSSKRGGV